MVKENIRAEKERNKKKGRRRKRCRDYENGAVITWNPFSSTFAVTYTVDDIFRSFTIFIFVVSCLHKHFGTG